MLPAGLQSSPVGSAAAKLDYATPSSKISTCSLRQESGIRWSLIPSFALYSSFALLIFPLQRKPLL